MLSFHLTIGPIGCWCFFFSVHKNGPRCLHREQDPAHAWVASHASADAIGRPLVSPIWFAFWMWVLKKNCRKTLESQEQKHMSQMIPNALMYHLWKKHSNDTAASLLPCPCPAEVNTEYQVQLMCWWPAAIEAMCCFGGVELPCFNDIESSMVNSNHPRDEQACSGFPTTLSLVTKVKVSILLHWNFTF